jgi:hypothetical protein
MRVSCFLLFSLFSSPLMAFADLPQICVRNVLKSSGTIDFCDMGMEGYAYAVDQERTEEVICTRVYDDAHCKNAPQEFDHVRSPAGEIFCTINFHQPPIAAPCVSSPQFYDWVTAAYNP